MGIAYAISKLGAALTGAEQVRGDSYCLAAGRRNFLVDYKFVRDISHHGKSTCFSIATDPDMPSACDGPGHAERGSGCVCITTTEEQSETV